jgi:hypothetical protein
LFAVLAGVYAAAALAVPAAAFQRASEYVPGSMGIPQPEPRVTLSVQNRSLGRVLAELKKQTPYQFRLLADIGTLAVTIDANREPVSQVLRRILEQDKRPDPLVFYFHENTFVIDREFIQVGEAEGENRVSLTNARISRALPELFKLMNVKHRIEPDVPPVVISMQLRPERWEQALSHIILEANKKEPGLTYSIDGDTYVVHLHKTPTGVTSSGQVLSTAGRRVTLMFMNTPLKEALAQLFMGSTWKFQVSEKVRDAPITLAVSDEPELSVLHRILRAASTMREPVTYREGKGMLYIEPGPLPGLTPAQRRPARIMDNP